MILNNLRTKANKRKLRRALSTELYNIWRKRSPPSLKQKTWRGLVPITELYYSLEERLGMKKCRQKHGGFWALLTPLGTYGYRYLPLTNHDAILLTKSFTPLVFAKKFMAFLFSGQSLREKCFLFRLWT